MKPFNAVPFKVRIAAAAFVTLVATSGCAEQQRNLPRDISGYHGNGGTPTDSLNHGTWAMISGGYTGTLFKQDWDNLSTPFSQSYEFRIGTTTVPGEEGEFVGMTLNSSGGDIGTVQLQAPLHVAIDGQPEMSDTGAYWVYRYKFISSYVFQVDALSPSAFAVVASLAFRAQDGNGGGTPQFDPAQSTIYFKGCELTGETADDGSDLYDCGGVDRDGNGRIDFDEEEDIWSESYGDAFFGNDLRKR